MIITFDGAYDEIMIDGVKLPKGDMKITVKTEMNIDFGEEFFKNAHKKLDEEKS